MSDNTFYSEFVRDMFVDEGDVNPANYGSLHAAVGLAGEAGEVLDLFKKVVFSGKDYDRGALIKELGDVEFYLQALRNQTGITRADVLEVNIRKLEARHPEGIAASTFYTQKESE